MLVLALRTSKSAAPLGSTVTRLLCVLLDKLLLLNKLKIIVKIVCVEPSEAETLQISYKIVFVGPLEGETLQISDQFVTFKC